MSSKRPELTTVSHICQIFFLFFNNTFALFVSTFEQDFGNYVGRTKPSFLEPLDVTSHPLTCFSHLNRWTPVMLGHSLQEFSKPYRMSYFKKEIIVF